MASDPVQRQNREVFVTRGASAADSRRIQRIAASGELLRIADGVYVAAKTPTEAAVIVRRNWHYIVDTLFPGGVISHRSGLVGGLISSEDMLVVTHPTRHGKSTSLPGLTIRSLKGPGALPGDMQIGSAGIFFSSRPRCVLENLQKRSVGPSPVSAGQAAVEKFLVRMLDANNEAGVNDLRDKARALAPALQAEAAFAKLDQMIGSLLRTRKAVGLVSNAGRLRAEGVDSDRIDLFEQLATSLRATALKKVEAIAVNEPEKSHFGLIESYFSNYVEGTKFLVEQAVDIVLHGHIVEARPKDSHDVLAVFQQAITSPWRDSVPAAGVEFPDGLASRHAELMKRRPEVGPGQFKLENNMAGSTVFVRPDLVRGTLIEGAKIAMTIPEGMARAIYYAFFVSEVHPFNDGNGRLSRLIMNAELSRTGESRIIIPTLFHEQYVDCQRALSRGGAADGLIGALQYIRDWTVALEYTDISKLIADLNRLNAMEESVTDFKLGWPEAVTTAPRPKGYK